MISQSHDTNDSNIRYSKKTCGLADCRMVQDPEKLQVPTLLIWGADDTALAPQLAHQTPQFVDDIEVHVLENCSHWVQQDR